MIFGVNFILILECKFKNTSQIETLFLGKMSLSFEHQLYNLTS